MSPLLQSQQKTLAELLPNVALPASVAGLVVERLVLDSREATPGCGFIALKGSVADGADYIDQAIAKGAKIIFSQSDSSMLSVYQQRGVCYVAIADLAQQVSYIAGRFFDCPSDHMSVVGITGTNGKTTCTQLLAQYFSMNQQTCGVLGTLGFGVYRPTKGSQAAKVLLEQTGLTTPDAISTQSILAEFWQGGATNVVLEASSHALEQGRVAGVAIDTAVFTNLTHDHLDYHGDMQAYGEAKKRLFLMPSVNKAVINIDDPFGLQLRSLLLQRNVELYTYSLKRADADFYMTSIEHTGHGSQFIVQTPFGARSSHTQLVGGFNLSNLLAVVATVIRNEQSLDAMAKILPRLEPVAGRMELIRYGDITVMIDYAHTPDALKNALSAAREHCQGRLFCVFGCGGNRDAAKRPVMGQIAESLADKVFVTNDNPRHEDPLVILEDILRGFKTPENIEQVLDRAEAIFSSVQQASAGDVVLIAGKGHEDYQQIGDHKHPFSDHETAKRALARVKHLRQVNGGNND